MTGPVVALVVTTMGLAVSTAGAIAAAAGAPEVAPWASAGGIATAVGALAYVAKLFADGRVVSFPVADLLRRFEERERELERNCNDRERKLTDLTHSVQADAEALRSMLLLRANNPEAQQ